MTEPNAGTGPGGAPPWEAQRFFCYACGDRIDARAEICPRCGVRQPPRHGPSAAPSVIDPEAPSKVAAGLLAILLGGLGVHRFYLGDLGLGLLYALFSWSGVPSVIGLIEGIVYLAKSDEAWAREHPAGRGGTRSIAIGCGISLALAIGLGIAAVVLVTLFAISIPESPAGAI
jgi:TM2 domain-containing membrane protein YozV